jgi:hypothetical protein
MTTKLSQVLKIPSVFDVLRQSLFLGNCPGHGGKQYRTRPSLGHLRLKPPAHDSTGVDQVRRRVNHGTGPVLVSNRAHFSCQ